MGTTGTNCLQPWSFFHAVQCLQWRCASCDAQAIPSESFLWQPVSQVLGVYAVLPVGRGAQARPSFRRWSWPRLYRARPLQWWWSSWFGPVAPWAHRQREHWRVWMPGPRRDFLCDPPQRQWSSWKNPLVLQDRHPPRLLLIVWGPGRQIIPESVLASWPPLRERHRWST